MDYALRPGRRMHTSSAAEELIRCILCNKLKSAKWFNRHQLSKLHQRNTDINSASQAICTECNKGGGPDGFECCECNELKPVREFSISERKNEYKTCKTCNIDIRAVAWSQPPPCPTRRHDDDETQWASEWSTGSGRLEEWSTGNNEPSKDWSTSTSGWNNWTTSNNSKSNEWSTGGSSSRWDDWNTSNESEVWSPSNGESQDWSPSSSNEFKSVTSEAQSSSSGFGRDTPSRLSGYKSGSSDYNKEEPLVDLWPGPDRLLGEKLDTMAGSDESRATVDSKAPEGPESSPALTTEEDSKPISSDQTADEVNSIGEERSAVTTRSEAVEREEALEGRLPGRSMGEKARGWAADVEESQADSNGKNVLPQGLLEPNSQAFL